MSKLFLLSLTIPGVSFFVVLSAAAESLPGIAALLVPVGVIVLLVALNGFFVAAEFSIIGVRATQLEQMADEGNSVAGRMLGVLDSRSKQDRYIATAKLGITIASVGLAMYGEPAISRFIEPYLALLIRGAPSEALINSLGYVIALSLLTYLHVVVGEMVPKSIALDDAMTMILRLARPMQVAQAILALPVRILNGIGRLLLRLFQIPAAEGHALVLPPDEIELIVTESAEDGLIKEGEEEMIRNIFDFGDRVVGQVMTPRPRVQAIPYDMPRDQMLKVVTESRHSRFPVYKNDLDHIEGILHLKDLVRQTIRSKSGFDLRLILRMAPAVPENYPVAKLLAVFKQRRLHMAVVLDEFGGMAGVVTLEDLVEEVVGEVRDEFDMEKEPFVEIAPGVIEVAGNYLVDDLVEVVDLGDPAALPDVETVGGLIVTWLGRPPAKGDKLVHQDVIRFEVLEVERRAVIRARIEFPAHDGTETGKGDGRSPAKHEN